MSAMLASLKKKILPETDPLADLKARRAAANRNLIRFQSEETRCRNQIAALKEKAAAAIASESALTSLFASQAAGETIAADAIPTAEAVFQSDAEAHRRAGPQIAGLEKTAASFAKQAADALDELKDIKAEIAKEQSAILNQRAMAARERYRAAARAFAAGVFTEHVAELRAMSEFAKAHGLPDPVVSFNYGHVLSLPTSKYWTPFAEIPEDIFGKAAVQLEQSGSLIFDVKEEISTHAVKVAEELNALLGSE